jgi:hypothetical protein
LADKAVQEAVQMTDDEMFERNLELLGGQGDPDKPVVIARMRTHRPLDLKMRPPQVFVPVTAAAG